MSSVFTAIVTAFRPDESLDHEAIRGQVRRQIAAGNDVFCCGTNGEFASLTFGEKVEVAALCAEESAGRARLIANAGCPSTHETLSLAREMVRQGVPEIAAVAPFFVSCTQEGLYLHFARLAEGLAVPLYLYNIPDRTRNAILPETAHRLAARGLVAGIKDSSGSAESLAAFARIASAAKGFTLYVGSDALIHAGLALGARGCVSGLANIVPRLVHSVVQRWDEGDGEGSRTAQEELARLRTALYALGDPPAVVKRALYLVDAAVGASRAPALAPDAALDARIRDATAPFLPAQGGAW